MKKYAALLAALMLVGCGTQISSEEQKNSLKTSFVDIKAIEYIDGMSITTNEAQGATLTPCKRFYNSPSFARGFIIKDANEKVFFIIASYEISNEMKKDAVIQHEICYKRELNLTGK